MTGLVNKHGHQWKLCQSTQGSMTGLLIGMAINLKPCQLAQTSITGLSMSQAGNENSVNSSRIHWQTFQSGDRAFNDGLGSPIDPKLGLLYTVTN